MCLRIQIIVIQLLQKKVLPPLTTLLRPEISIFFLMLINLNIPLEIITTTGNNYDLEIK
jgi:hypothetical protein